MSVANLKHRTSVLDERANQRTMERMMRQIALELGVTSDLLRAEALALHQQFVDAGVCSEAAKLALVARELKTTPEQLKREVDAVLAAC